ncbi:MAG TPA: hypothetical protein VFZ86_00490 [Thermoleophilia bacterium]|nr:hypothetical protein [Thermoleophilia bacterium]
MTVTASDGGAMRDDHILAERIFLAGIVGCFAILALVIQLIAH